ncbi:MAG: recombinase family protein [Bacteroidota bacterium]|nr:recombinase family protein [Bacteroidota bacterium]
MNTADLYIRVSTDEQADKGYSQRNQEETLRKYCQINQLQIGRVIYEDHSAKTFIRPRWSELLISFRKKRPGSGHLLLFTKWDRFSRNAGDAYQMISTLRKLGIEPQAVEQPLDLTIPENKMMLAFYLAAPEVENDRRALNVFFGMRRAKKEGRWMGSAPIGYQNLTNEHGRKYIAPKNPEAAIIKWAFEELARGEYAADQIRKEVNKRGLVCSRSNFWNAIRNPVYCGRIAIAGYKDEKSTTVKGQHEPIISEALYYEVQDILSGRKRKTRPATQISVDENLPLRGFLICPKCSKILTGSASKGTYQYYYYYHCTAKCGVRFRTQVANDCFVQELRKYNLHPELSDLYVLPIKEAYYEQTSGAQNEIRQLMQQIEDYTQRLKNAREMVADQKLDLDDYRELKQDCTQKITVLEAKLSGFSVRERNIDKLLEQAVQILGRLDRLYEEGNSAQKRRIISSIYPEKLVFDGSSYRTNRINEAVRVIYKLDKALREIKNRKSVKNLSFSGVVVPTRIELVSKV